MKTAEEWVLDWRKAVVETDVFRTCEPDGLEFRQFEAEFYKQIQLDAMKEGMRRAAEQARQTGLQYGDYDADRDGRIVGNAAQQAILTAAEQLTEKDL